MATKRLTKESTFAEVLETAAENGIYVNPYTSLRYDENKDKYEANITHIDIALLPKSKLDINRGMWATFFVEVDTKDAAEAVQAIIDLCQNSESRKQLEDFYKEYDEIIDKGNKMKNAKIQELLQNLTPRKTNIFKRLRSTRNQ